jgi:hypothetical protein
MYFCFGYALDSFFFKTDFFIGLSGLMIPLIGRFLFSPGALGVIEFS